MTDEDERCLDNETAELMEKITFSQIAEALNYYVDEADDEERLAAVVQKKEHAAIGVILTSICYAYWRGCLAYQHECDNEWWDPDRSDE